MNDRHMLRRQRMEDNTPLRHLMQTHWQSEGAALWDAYLSSGQTEMLPVQLDHRCRQTIQQHFRRQKSLTMLLNAAKKVACIGAVLLFTIFVTLSVSQEVRAAVSSWLSGWDGGLYVYAPTDTDEVTPDYDYRLSKIPAGYALSQDFYLPTGGLISYLDEENSHSLHLMYCRQDEGSEMDLILTEELHKIVTVNSVTADLYYYPDLHDDSSLVWIDPETNYLLHISGYFPEEILVELAENLIRTQREPETP